MSVAKSRCVCHFQPRHCEQRSLIVRAGSRKVKCCNKQRKCVAEADGMKDWSSNCQQFTSLKEWAPICSAIGCGDQTILLRKGGIREPTFVPTAREFLLFPTAFHTEAKLLKPDSAIKFAQELQYDPRMQPHIKLSVLAQLTGAWTTYDPKVFELLDNLHVWGPGFLESRLRWRERQPITVMELRGYRLENPIALAPHDSFWGCFSWVDLSASFSGDGNKQLAFERVFPALNDGEFASRQRECREMLATITMHSLQLPS